MGMLSNQQVLHMNGGLGETSYANNSLLQRKVMMRAKPVLAKSIKRLCCTITLPSCLKVAELDCSSGPNALLLASNIINIVDETSRSLNFESPTFQIFLNDLFENDFNTIFKSLSAFYHTLKQQKGENFVSCFINAMPGTSMGGFFPPIPCIFSIPLTPSIGSLRLQKGQVGKQNHLITRRTFIYVTSINPPSYVEQFKEDFKLFLKLRSEELVPGGGMLLTFIGRYETSEIITSSGLICLVLNGMVSENLIEEEKLECFSMPFYTPTAEEVREIVNEEGSFSVERLDSIKTSWDGLKLDEDGSDSFVDEMREGSS